MAEPLRVQQQVALFKKELIYANPQTMNGSNALLVHDLDVSILENETIGRNNISGQMGSQGAATVSQHNKVSFGVELVGSGDPLIAPAWGPVLEACGFAAIVDSGAQTITYKPIDEGFTSATMLYRLRKLEQAIPGMRGGVKFVLDNKSIPKMSFTMQGLFEQPILKTTVLSGISTAAFKDPIGVITGNVATCTLLGAPIKMSKLTIDPGITTKYVDDLDSNSVEIEARAGQVEVTYRVDEQEVIDATRNARENLKGSFVFAMGSTPGSKVSVVVPTIQVKSAKRTFDGEFAYMTVTADIVPAGRNEDLLITQS